MTEAGLRADLVRWAVSAAIILAAHAGLAAALLVHTDGTVAAEPAAALVVMLAPVPTTPADRIEAPPGPEQTEGQASPYVPQDTADPVVDEKVERGEQTPEEVPQGPAADVAAAAQPEPKPAQPQASSLAAPATTAPEAPPQAVVATVAAAPEQGRPNASSAKDIPNWKTRVASLLERNKRYPSQARERHEQGTAQLLFSIDRAGRVVKRRILRSSGSAALDEESLELVWRAQPFPPPPAAMAGAEIELAVPVRFSIR